MWHLLRGLAHCGDDHWFTVFVGNSITPLVSQALPALHWQAAPWSMHRKLTRVAWESLSLPRAARHLNLLHAPVNVLPARLPCPGVVTVHDLAFLRFPLLVSPQRHRYLSRAIAASVRRASMVIAVSEATRADLLTTWGVPPERVRVVYPAIDATLGPITDAERCAAFRRRMGVLRPYILFVGTLEPRKNLATLIDAFGLARARGLLDHDLILVGGTDWEGGRYVDALRAQIAARHLHPHVRLTGYVSMADRALWYACASALALPSWYEGFGFPVVEAMACGIPVIASRAGSLPEVVGDAGQLCDPADVDGWAAALCRVVAEPAWAERARQSATTHAARFTEAALARGTMAVYDAALGGGQWQVPSPDAQPVTEPV